MLTDLQLAEMRATVNDALPDTCLVQRRTIVNDGGGGQTETWADHATVACRIAPVGGGEGRVAGGRVEDETTHVVTMPAGTDVTEADRLVISSRTYEVTLVHERGAWELSKRVEAKEAP
jgi:SPP1 family predicted phage head-tail adaptor